MAKIIDGKAFADGMCDELATQVRNLPNGGQAAPCLAVVLVGEDPASHVYVRNKVRRCEQIGIRSVEHRLPATTTETELLHLIAAMNSDTSIHGILVQLPLPSQITEKAVINAIDPVKDVDGFHLANVGALSVGERGMVPCTPLGSLMLLQHQVGDLSGLHAVVIGRSNIVGKPMVQLLLQQNCTVTVVHSRSRDIQNLCRQADILVAAVGAPGLVKADWVKPGALVIDVGINRIEEDGKSKLVGDVDFDRVVEIAGAITPVPGGVGPMTIACLMHNTLQAYRRQTSGTKEVS